MALVLCACGQTEAAKHADETIAAIGQVTESSLRQIEKAEAALPAIRADAVSGKIANALAMEIETVEDITAFQTAAVGIQEKYGELNDAEKSMVVDYDKFEEKVKDGGIALAKLSLKDVKIWTKQIYSHLEVYINFKNSSEKTIKYITWGVMFQNPVGDYMAYRGDPIHLCRDTGPYETGKGTA